MPTEQPLRPPGNTNAEHYNGFGKKRIKRLRCVPLLYPLFSKSVKLAEATDERIEPCAFTPGSFGPNNPLASEMQDTGVRVA